MTRPNAVAVVSVFSLLFAVAAGWLTYGYLQREMDSVKAVQPQRIVVAAADIPIGSAIKPSQVKITSWPKDSIPPGSANDAETVVSRVAIRPITKGDAITEPKLKPKTGATGSGFMTYVVPQGHRAVTVAVNEVAGVAGFLTPSDRVDVIVTTPLPGNEKESISKIVLENVPVLATGQITDQKEGKPVVVPTVTLDLVPEDAEKLVLSASKGSLQLLLRNISDTSHVESRGATIGKVLGGFEPVRVKTVERRVATPPPAPRPVAVVKAPPSHTLEIVRGTEKTSRQYPE
ncbi:Flp pilus assembly protein CpaB [Geomonas paludis]|uniref:Flp pilus assembly protein CpaB n=1 Tax=Geomonas paludis TaxID=2740185 RepID=A0A6V8MXD6_9BACT|nr:Flp pilus assembly protein CpaB [Geomonas paludis]UPU37028.1 Flp pilus assembly protein CpaB [Geomonas paludis]GFO64878.1 pilus assembly-related, exported protein [Geomonas paludis]